MITENTVGYLKVKCTACNNERVIRAQRGYTNGGKRECVQVTFALGQHLPSCPNRKCLQATLAAPLARGVTKYARKGQLSITGVKPPTP